MILIFLIILAPVVGAQEATITVDQLNVREGPGIHFQKIGDVFKGDTFKILQKENDWVEIELEEGTGWVSTEYITIHEDNSETEVFKVPEKGKQTLTIPLDRVHLRSGPSIEYDINFFVNQGDEVTIISESDEWYEIKYDDHVGFLFKRLVTSQKNNSSPLLNKLIVIDAGHGGRDVGATGTNETLEKHLTFKTAKLLKHELIQLGATVKLTRENDQYISLLSRATFSNMLSTDAFISIHYNSFPELPNIKGIGTYYYHPHHKQLAQAVQRELIHVTGDHDREIALENYQVLRQSVKPAILVELGFISNKTQEQQLLSRSYQQLLVQGIASGLTTYFSNKKE